MLEHNLLDVSILHIKLFLLLAEERNFSRVAALTNMTQPTLSKRIAQLEQTLNMHLFNRKARPVSLTPEGKTLYNEWKLLCNQFDNAVEMAEKVKLSRSDAITFCSNDASGHHISIPAIAAWIQKKVPRLHVNLRYIPFSGWRTQLLSGEIDLFETILLETIDLDEALSWEQLTVCPKQVGMLKTNPLAGKEVITFEDLQDQRFVVISPMESPHYFRYVRQICLDHGFEPHISTHVANAANLISSISADDEVVICDKYIRDHDNPMMKYFPLPDTWSGQVVIWKKDNPNRFLPEAVQAIKEYHEKFVETIL